MAFEDAWVLAEHVKRQTGRSTTAAGAGWGIDWDAALAVYNAVRPAHCRRVLTTARAWGELWHHVGDQRQWRNTVLLDRDVHDYSYVDWLYGPTATTPEEMPAMFS